MARYSRYKIETWYKDTFTGCKRWNGQHDTLTSWGYDGALRTLISKKQPHGADEINSAWRSFLDCITRRMRWVNVDYGRWKASSFSYDVKNRTFTERDAHEFFAKNAEELLVGAFGSITDPLNKYSNEYFVSVGTKTHVSIPSSIEIARFHNDLRELNAVFTCIPSINIARSNV